MEAKTTANKTIETQRFQSHGSIQACRGSTSTFESKNQPGTGADIMNKAGDFADNFGRRPKLYFSKLSPQNRTRNFFPIFWRGLNFPTHGHRLRCCCAVAAAAATVVSTDRWAVIVEIELCQIVLAFLIWVKIYLNNFLKIWQVKPLRDCQNKENMKALT
jgi:hypothetical protein